MLDLQTIYSFSQLDLCEFHVLQQLEFLVILIEKAFASSVLLQILVFKDPFTHNSCPYQGTSPVIESLSGQFNSCSTSGMVFKYLKICQLDPLCGVATYLCEVVNPQENIFEHFDLI